jgi:hypothetical protein
MASLDGGEFWRKAMSLTYLDARNSPIPAGEVAARFRRSEGGDGAPELLRRYQPKRCRHRLCACWLRQDNLFGALDQAGGGNGRLAVRRWRNGRGNRSPFLQSHNASIAVVVLRLCPLAFPTDSDLSDQPIPEGNGIGGLP